MRNEGKKLCLACRHYFKKRDMVITRLGYTCKNCQKRLNLTQTNSYHLR